MNIEKLPSGKYRIVQMVQGKRYRITLDHKPSKVEAMKLVSDMVTKSAPTEKHNMTVLDACNAYLEAKSNVLSPSTIDRYNVPKRAISEEFKAKHLNAITTEDFQKEVNRYSIGRSPKTVRNFTSFLSTVFKFFNLGLQQPTIPQPVKVKKYIPTREEARKICEYYKGTKYEIFFRLASHGLRRSEIFALTLDDLDGVRLTINKAKVQGADGKWVIKTTKTTDSTRVIKIDDDLADMIRKQGYVWKGSAHYPYEKLRKAQDALGIPRFGIHTFRHFFASVSHDAGVPDKIIEYVGGWKTDHVMKTVYEHAMEIDKALDKTSDLIGSIYK